ncbi:oligosaccharyl transferase subunit ost3/OST6 [Coemansia sp. Benny D115]|nr:oligosaccharyl transferase subunit ost3/OST6 [Coemansia sp. Benny D115]
MQAIRAIHTLLLLAVLLVHVSGQSLKALQKQASQDPDGLARLSLAQFIKHVVPEAKDYSVVIQLTALAPKYKCEPCKLIDSTLRAVSRGWRAQKKKTKHQILFATLDVEDAEEMFQQMKIENIPKLMIFPAGRGAFAFDNPSPREMTLSPRVINAEAMAAKLGELFGIEIRAQTPVDYLKHLRNVAAGLASCYAVYLVYQHVDLRVLGRNLWAILSILFVLLMTSGYMWTRINDPPYVGQTRQGEPVLFAPVNNQQYGIETQVVAAAYAVCALCVVALVRHVPKIEGAEQRTFVTMMFVVALIMTFSYVNSVFRMKMPGYPFMMLLP